MLEENRFLYDHVGQYYKPMKLSEQMDHLIMYLNTKNLKYRNDLVFANYKLIKKCVINISRNWNLKDDQQHDMFFYAVESALKSLDRYTIGRGTTTVPSWINTCVMNDLYALLKRSYTERGNLNIIDVSPSYKDNIINDRKIYNQVIKTNEVPIKNIKYNVGGEELVYRGTNDISFFSIDELEHFDLCDNTDVETELNNELLEIIKDILSKREFLIFKNIALGIRTKKDIIYEIPPLNSQELEKLENRGKNEIIINNKLIEVIWSKFYKGEKESVKNGTYVFSSSELTEVIYNGKDVKPRFINSKYLYNIKLDNEGYSISGMSAGIIYNEALTKLRNFLIKNKIKNITDYADKFTKV